MQGPISFAALLILVWGVLGLISPRIFKTKTRWVAASLVIACFFMLAVSQYLWPEKGTEAGAADAFSVVVWFFGGLFLFVVFLRIAWRANAIKHAADLPHHWLDFAARPWGDMARRTSAKIVEKRDAEQSLPSPIAKAAEHVSMAPPPPPPVRTPPPAPLPVRLPPTPKPARPVVKVPPKKPVQDYRPPVVDDEPDVKPTKSDNIVPDTQNAPTSNKGRSVWITYVDSDGEVTEREVANWVMTRIHLEGRCLLRKRNRLFRRDRIIEWGEWS